MPQVVKILFRRKKKSPTTLATFTNVRVEGGRTPKQLHLGYVPEREGLTPENKEKVSAKLKEKWRATFDTDDVIIDWYDAARKWALKTRGEDVGPDALSNGGGGGTSSGPTADDGYPPALHTRQSLSHKGPFAHGDRALSRSEAIQINTHDQRESAPPIEWSNTITAARIEAKRLGLQEADAEDIASTAIIRMTRIMQHNEPIENISAYMRTVVRNISIDYIRRMPRSPSTEVLSGSVIDPSPSPQQEAVGRERVKQLQDMLSKIKNEDRRLIEKRMEGLSFSELSKYFQLPPNVLKKRFYRALLQMRALLNEV